VGPRSGPGWLRSVSHTTTHYRLVFGAHDPKQRADNSSLHASDAGRLNHRVEVSGGIMAEDCACLLRAFFQQRRNQSKKTATFQWPSIFSAQMFQCLRFTSCNPDQSQEAGAKKPDGSRDGDWSDASFNDYVIKVTVTTTWQVFPGKDIISNNIIWSIFIA